MSRLISEAEFTEHLKAALSEPEVQWAGWVTGIGRSGAIAAAYASHMLNLKFVSFGLVNRVPEGSPLVIHGVIKSEAAMKYDLKRYQFLNPVHAVVVYDPTATLWFEKVGVEA